MQLRRVIRAQSFHLAVAGLAALVMLASASQARAADEDVKGWFVALDFAMTQPNSLDQHFANQITSATDFNRLVIDNDADFTWRASAGYGFGKGMGSLQVSYWTFDNEDRQQGTSSGTLYPTIFGYGYANGGMYI